MSRASRFRVGCSGQSLWGTWKAKLPLADDVTVRVLVAGLGDRRIAMAVCDFCIIWPSVALLLRERVAEAIGAPVDHVGIFCTQNHAAPGLDRTGAIDLDQVTRRFVAAARAAREQMKPAEMALAAATLDPPGVYCRRYPLPDVGTFCFFFGFRTGDAARAPGVSHLLQRATAALARGEPAPVRHLDLTVDAATGVESPMPIPEPAELQAAADNRLQGLFFRTPGDGGDPIASLLRFPAHPALSNAWSGYQHGGDYPFYACRRLEEALGSPAIFLTGPCGDQAPPIGRKSVGAAQEFGYRLADAALAQIKSIRWETVDHLAADSPTVRLPVRNDLPVSHEAAREELARINGRMADAGRRRTPLHEIKRLAERHETLTQLVVGRAAYRWCGIDLMACGGGWIEHPLFNVRIGSVVLAGLPGEPFGAFSRELRNRTIGDRLIVAEEANGYLCYLPTAAQYPEGSYEVCVTLFTPAAEAHLLNTATAAIRRLAPARFTRP